MKCVSVSFDTFAFSFLFVSNMKSFFSLLYFYTVFNVQYLNISHKKKHSKLNTICLTSNSSVLSLERR